MIVLTDNRCTDVPQGRVLSRVARWDDRLVLQVGGSWGPNRAREPFELAPELVWGEDDRFSEWSVSLGRRLFPLGELSHGRFFLRIDEGREICLVETWVASFGPMPHTLENLILGVMPRRIDDAHRQSDQAR